MSGDGGATQRAKLRIRAFSARIARDRRTILKLVSVANDVTFVRLRGNIGDHLIWAGARQMLRGVAYEEAAAEDLGTRRGDLALMAGSGGWCEPFHGLAPQTLQELGDRFRRVIVLPSTFDADYPLTRQVLLHTHAVVFARERVSYHGIRTLCHARLAHDCAFYFDYRPYLRSGSGRLLAYRTDAESAIDWASRGGLPVENNDISRTCKSLDEWLWTIARHEQIWTDRAHVMIAAAMLGKSVRFAPTLYHKVPAIAQYSLSTMRAQEAVPG